MFSIKEKREWRYLPMVYAVLLTVSLAIITVIPFNPPVLKILTILFAATLLFWVTFYFKPFRHLVLRLINHSREQED
jgi:hypothetical protein